MSENETDSEETDLNRTMTGPSLPVLENTPGLNPVVTSALGTTPQ